MDVKVLLSLGWLCICFGCFALIDTRQRNLGTHLADHNRCSPVVAHAAQVPAQEPALLPHSQGAVAC